MSTRSDTVQKLVQFYKQCYQASFQTQQGEGLFADKAIQPVHFVNGSFRLDNNTIDRLIREWLLDQENTYLVRFSDFILFPTPNESGTTETHYLPGNVHDGFADIYNLQQTKPGDHKANQSIDFLAVQDAAPQISDLFQSDPGVHVSAQVQVDELPNTKQLNHWFAKKARVLKEPARLRVHVLALVPRNYRSTAYKQDLMRQLDQISDRPVSPTSMLSNVMRRTDLFEFRSSAPRTRSPLEQIVSEDQLLNIPFLSPQQQQAFMQAMAFPVSCVQGPPGTGKSFFLASLACALSLAGKNVLIATHSDHALTVIRDKLVNDLGLDGDLIAHFGYGRRTGHFVEQLNRLAKSVGGNSDAKKLLNAYLMAQQQTIDRTQEIKDNLVKTPTLSSEILLQKPSLLNKIKQWVIRIRSGAQPDVVNNMEQLAQQLHQSKYLLGAAANAFLRQKFNSAYQSNKSAWGTAGRLIGQSNVAQAMAQFQAKQQDEFELQQGLNIWLMTLDDITTQTHGNFDYVIIDEATQVNLASSIPALSKAENLVVIGDRKQLRHYSFLSAEQEQRIAQRLNLTSDTYSCFRTTSFLDYIDDYLARTGQYERVTLLDEHYRSTPILMQFNSDQFYDGEVKVLTGFSSQLAANTLHLEWQFIPGSWQEKNNHQEAMAIVSHIKALVSDTQSCDENTSIGVLSFFTAQAELLKKMLVEHIATDVIKRYRIKVGTPFSFQGEERSHMLISCAVDTEAHHATWNYLNKADVFNVATSRARRVQTLFLSMPPNKLPPTSLLKQYYEYSQRKSQPSETLPVEPWLQSLMDVLKRAGFTCQWRKKIAEIDIDLLLERHGHRLAVDLIGFPGDVGDAIHIKRYKALHRAGIPLYPLTAIEWYLDQETCVGHLARWINDKQSRLSLLDNTVDPMVSSDVMEIQDDALQPLLYDDHLLRLNQLLNAKPLNGQWGLDIVAQSSLLRNIGQLLMQMFEVGSLTYGRYQASINASVKKYLDNVSAFIILHEQVWQAKEVDQEYWQTLIQPIQDRNKAITESLTVLLTELQKQVAKKVSHDQFVLDDLEHLTKRLQDY